MTWIHNIADLGIDEFFVSQRHIDQGIRLNCEHCPIALSLYEYVKDLEYNHVSAFDNWVRFAKPMKSGDRYYDMYYHVYMSKEVKIWLKSFDNQDDVKPMKMFIDRGVPNCFYMEGESRPYMTMEHLD